jgi:hypothetical protein
MGKWVGGWGRFVVSQGVERSVFLRVKTVYHFFFNRESTQFFILGPSNKEKQSVRTTKAYLELKQNHFTKKF